MCPVNQPTSFVPDVLPRKLNFAADSNSTHARRDVDVVDEEHRLPIWKPNENALVPGAVVVVRQHSQDFTAPAHRHVGLVLRSKDHARIQTLLDQYQERFVKDFLAVMPAKEKSTQARVG